MFNKNALINSNNKWFVRGGVILIAIVIAACISVCTAFAANADVDNDATNESNSYDPVTFYLKYDAYSGETPEDWNKETIDGVNYFTREYEYGAKTSGMYPTWSQVESDIEADFTLNCFYNPDSFEQCYYDSEPCSTLRAGINQNGKESNTASIVYALGTPITLDVTGGDTEGTGYSYWGETPAQWQLNDDGSLTSYAMSSRYLTSSYYALKFIKATLNSKAFVHQTEENYYYFGTGFSLPEEYTTYTSYQVDYALSSGTAVKVITGTDTTGVTNFAFTEENEGWFAKKRNNSENSPYDFYCVLAGTQTGEAVANSFTKSVDMDQSIIDPKYKSDSPQILSGSGFAGSENLDQTKVNEANATFTDIGRVTLDYSGLASIKTPDSSTDWIKTGNNTFVKYYSTDTEGSVVINDIGTDFDAYETITKKNADNKYGKLNGITLSGLDESEQTVTGNTTVAFSFIYNHDVKLNLDGGNYYEAESELTEHGWTLKNGYYVKEFVEGTMFSSTEDSDSTILKDLDSSFYDKGFIREYYDSETKTTKTQVIDSANAKGKYEKVGSWTDITTATGQTYEIKVKWIDGIKFSIDLGEGGSYNGTTLPTGWYVSEDGLSLYTYQFANETTGEEVYDAVSNDFTSYKKCFQQAYKHEDGEDETIYYKKLDYSGEDATYAGKKPWSFADDFKIDETNPEANKCDAVYTENKQSVTIYLLNNQELIATDQKKLTDAGWAYSSGMGWYISNEEKYYEVGTPVTTVQDDLKKLELGWYIVDSTTGQKNSNYVFSDDYATTVEYVTSGCYLIPFMDYKPTLSGKVADSSTDDAIENATVVISCLSGGFYSNEFKYTTDANGQFSDTINFGNAVTIQQLMSGFEGSKNDLVSKLTLLNLQDIRVDVIPPDGSHKAISVRLDKLAKEDSLNFALDSAGTNNMNVRVDTQEILYWISNLLEKYGSEYWDKLVRNLIKQGSYSRTVGQYLQNYTLEEALTMYPYVKDYTSVEDGEEPEGKPIHNSSADNSYINLPSTAYYVFKEPQKDASLSEDKYFQTLIIYDKDPNTNTDAKMLYKYYINVTTCLEDLIHINSSCNMMVVKNNSIALNNNTAENGIISEGVINSNDSFVIDFTGPLKQLFFTDNLYNILFTTGSTNNVFEGSMELFADASQKTVSGSDLPYAKISKSFDINSNIVNFLYPTILQNFFDVEGVNNKNFTITANEDGSIDVVYSISGEDVQVTIPNSLPSYYSGNLGVKLHMKPSDDTGYYGYTLNGLHIPTGVDYNLLDENSELRQYFEGQTTLLCRLDCESTISGKVYDAELTSVPIPGVGIQTTTASLTNPDDVTTNFVATGSDISKPTELGTYTIPVVKDKTCQLDVNVDPLNKGTQYDGYEEASYTIASTSESITKDIALKPKSTEIFGTVVDGDGLAVSGATVTFSSDLKTSFPALEDKKVSTDSNGKYDFESIRKAVALYGNSGTITIKKDGYRDVVINVESDDFANDTKDFGSTLLFNTSDTIILKGKVSQQDGNNNAVFKSPVEGVTATLTYGGQTQTTKTAADGSYSFTGLSKGLTGQVVLHKDNMQDDVTFVIDADLSVKNIFGESIMVPKAETQVKISGKVTSKRTGVLIPNAKINFTTNTSSDEQITYSAVTDADGNYTQYLLNNTDTDLNTSATGYQTDEQTLTKSEITGDVVRDIELNNADVKVFGTVKDTDGNKISGVSVVFTPESGEARSATTDANGYFELNIEEGVAGTFTLTKDEYSTVTKQITAAEAVAGEITFDAMKHNVTPEPEPTPTPTPTPTPSEDVDATATGSATGSSSTGDTVLPFVMMFVLLGAGATGVGVYSRKRREN